MSVHELASVRAPALRDLIIGIDPGVHTGFAVWRITTRQLTVVTSVAIHEAMNIVQGRHADGRLHSVVFEDARQRTGSFGLMDLKQAKFGAAVREGVGSVKRDCTIWHDYLTALGVKFEARKPSAGTTKWDAATFAKVTKWTGRTNEHGRDAAILIYGR